MLLAHHELWWCNVAKRSSNLPKTLPKSPKPGLRQITNSLWSVWKTILHRALGKEFLVDLMKIHKVKFYKKLQENINVLANHLQRDIKYDQRSNHLQKRRWNIKIYCSSDETAKWRKTSFLSNISWNIASEFFVDVSLFLQDCYFEEEESQLAQLRKNHRTLYVYFKFPYSDI